MRGAIFEPTRRRDVVMCTLTACPRMVRRRIRIRLCCIPNGILQIGSLGLMVVEDDGWKPAVRIFSFLLIPDSSHSLHDTAAANHRHSASPGFWIRMELIFLLRYCLRACIGYLLALILLLWSIASLVTTTWAAVVANTPIID